MKKFVYTINGVKYRVEILSTEDNVAEIEVNGTKYSVGLEAAPKDKPLMRTISKPSVAPVATTVAASVSDPVAPVPTTTPTTTPAAAPASAPASGGSPVISPLPGVIIKVLVNPGDKVTKGQKLMILEAMKMENDIKAPKDGIVASIAVSVNDNVQEGVTLLTLN